MVSLARKIIISLFIMSAGCFLASLLYPDQFSFVTEPLSALGGLKTYNGLYVNGKCHAVYSVACVTSGIILISTWSKYRIKSLLLMGAGLILMSIPHDLFLAGHQIASATAVAGAYFFCTAHLLFYRSEHISLLLFQAAILSYAFLHLTGSHLREEFQTLALAAIILAMADASRLLSSTKKGRFQVSLTERRPSLGLRIF